MILLESLVLISIVDFPFDVCAWLVFYFTTHNIKFAVHSKGIHNMDFPLHVCVHATYWAPPLSLLLSLALFCLLLKGSLRGLQKNESCGWTHDIPWLKYGTRFPQQSGNARSVCVICNKNLQVSQDINIKIGFNLPLLIKP